MVLTRMGNYIYSNMSFLLFYVYHSYAHWISKTYKSPTESCFSPPLPVYMFFFRSWVLPFIHEIMILRVRRMPTTIIFTIPGGDVMREFNWRKTLQLHLNEGSTNKFYIWSSISSSSCAPTYLLLSLAWQQTWITIVNYTGQDQQLPIKYAKKIKLIFNWSLSFSIYYEKSIRKRIRLPINAFVHSFICLSLYHFDLIRQILIVFRWPDRRWWETPRPSIIESWHYRYFDLKPDCAFIYLLVVPLKEPLSIPH